MKRHAPGRFDPEAQRAVIIQSVCTGEQSLYFIDKKDGTEHQVGCIRSPEDLEAYLKEYHLRLSQIEREV